MHTVYVLVYRHMDAQKRLLQIQSVYLLLPILISPKGQLIHCLKGRAT